MTRFLRFARFVWILILCTVLLVVVAALWNSHPDLASSINYFIYRHHEHYALLNWKASPSHIVGYDVYRSDKPEGPYKKLNSSPVQETSYKDSALHAGHKYYYVVTAVGSNGRESVFSNQVVATVPSP